MFRSMLVALLTLFFAALAFWMASYVSRETGAVRDWPTVSGKILERGVGEPMQSVSRAYLPHVKYSYSVGGKQYVNDQVYVIRRTGNLADSIRRLVDSLPDPVPVHYDPKDPAHSYLLANSPWTFWTLVLFGVGATIAGLLQLLVMATKSKG